MATLGDGVVLFGGCRLRANAIAPQQGKTIAMRPRARSLKAELHPAAPQNAAGQAIGLLQAELLPALATAAPTPLTVRAVWLLLAVVPLVLTHKPSTSYDDVPEERYHFPRTYLGFIEASEGDWFVYYEPRRGGRQSYVALARLGRVWPDPKLADHFYVGVSEFQEFVEPVPWREGGVAYESALQSSGRSTNLGQFQRAVRQLPLGEFNTIVQRGFAQALREEPLTVPLAADSLVEIEPRPVVEMLLHRQVRDRAFASTVNQAYDRRCAFTGLRIVNGGGWVEVEAAHIRPVKDDGPDSIRNGMALSRTMHALFDRGFLALTDDWKIIEARSAPLPDQLRAQLPANRQALVPENTLLRPHAAFLRYHRSHVFKDSAA